MIAVLRAERELLLAINRHLAAIGADGTLADMERRWFRWEGP